MPILAKTTAALATGVTMALCAALPSDAMPVSRAAASGAGVGEAPASTILVRGGARYDKLRQRDAEETRLRTFRDAESEGPRGQAAPWLGRDGGMREDNT